MQYIDAFLRYEFASEVMIVCGSVFLLIGVLKILRSSLSLLFWVALAGLGAASVAYGLDRGSAASPAELLSEIRRLAEPGRESTAEVLRVLCDELESSLK